MGEKEKSKKENCPLRKQQPVVQSQPRPPYNFFLAEMLIWHSKMSDTHSIHDG